MLNMLNMCGAGCCDVMNSTRLTSCSNGRGGIHADGYSILPPTDSRNLHICCIHEGVQIGA